jgi:hypothetical protein
MIREARSAQVTPIARAANAMQAAAAKMTKNGVDGDVAATDTFERALALANPFNYRGGP